MCAHLIHNLVVQASLRQGVAAHSIQMTAVCSPYPQSCCAGIAALKATKRVQHTPHKRLLENEPR